MANDLSATTILVPAKMHERVLARLGDTFRVVRIDKAHPDLLDDELRASPCAASRR